MDNSQSKDIHRPAGLIYFEGQEKPKQYVVFSRAMVMGQREMEIYTTSSLQLPYPFLDKEQCEIFQRDGQWYYKNLSEEVFTFVGGRHLKKDGEAKLSDGTVIRLSNERMLTMVFFKDFARSTDWQIINMDDGRHVVTIQNESEGFQEYIRLTYNNGRWSLQDMNAANIFFNGERITEPSPIQIDDCIQIGDTKFIFEGSGLVYGYPTMGGGLSIDIDERSVHNALKKVTLLKDINLSIEPGNMVLILGGSGAGKSTFVNAVTGYEKAKATIREADLDFYRQYDQVKHRIGFVPQDNLLREEDTVGDTVKNAAEMRLPSNTTDKEKADRVNLVLATFGLSGREGELVSKLSGGQKKRLSICTEFVANPSLFILDEPDSGLDGIMATELMENLRMIACQGKIVMVITHSPDRVSHLFDKVIVLAKGGKDRVGQLAFYGEIQEAKEFFHASTMEGIVKLVNAVNEGGDGRADEFIDKYKEYDQQRGRKVRQVFKDAEAREELEEEERPKPQDFTHYKGRLAQIPVYLGKLFRLFITEKNWKVLPMSAIIDFLVVYVLGRAMFRTMEGTAYGALAIICVCIWNGMFNSIQSVCKERSIIKREHRTGLHITSYLAAHMIYQAVICFLQVVIALVIFKMGKVYMPEAGLMTGSFMLDLGICMFLSTYASDMLALMISCIVKNPTAAMTVMPFLLIVQLVFAGSVFPLNRRLAQKMSYFSISNWGITAVCTASNYNAQNSTVLTVAVGKMQGQEEDDIISKVQDVMALPEVNQKVREFTAEKLQKKEYEYTRENLGKSWRILSLFAAVYAFIGLLFLENVDKDKR